MGATVAALQGLGAGHAARLILIAGGDGKGQDFSPLAAAIARHVKTVVLIGRDAPLIAQAIASTQVPVIHCDSLPQAVNAAAEQATQGDQVLLSPACASFDMFSSYAHRAQVFVDAVRELGLTRGEVIA